MIKNKIDIPSWLMKNTKSPGIVIYISYIIAFYAVFIYVGVDYARIGESGWTLSSWLIPPLLAGFVVVVFLVSEYDLWQPAFRERHLLPIWAIFVPVLACSIAVINMLFGDFTTVTSTMWVYLFAGCVIVGFNEEMVHRGTLLVSLRNRFDEMQVWLITCAMFGLFHLPNIFFGIGTLAILQVFIAFGMGSVFYLARRTTGSLAFSMILHGLWDFSAFASHVPYSGLAAPFLGLVATCVAAIAIRWEAVKDRTLLKTGFETYKTIEPSK